MKKYLPIVVIALFFASLIRFPSEAEEPEIKVVLTQPIITQEIEVIEEETEFSIDPIAEELDRYVALENEMRYLDEFKDDKKEYLIRYKEVVEEYRDYCGAPVMLEDVYTIEEIDLMCRCVMTEIGGGSFDAKVNVATVIFNRIDSEIFPNNPTAVITAPSQFAYSKSNYDESIIQALEYAYLFEVPEVKDALFFQSIAGWSSWNGRSLKHTDGYHWFY